MAIKFSFELDEQDLRYFQRIIESKGLGSEVAIRDVVVATRDLLSRASQADTPKAIMAILRQLEPLVEMVTDEEWDLPPEDVARVLTALAYFSDPEDLIPDDVPGLGYLDDAVMVEMACRSLRPELDAYLDFCRFRQQRAARQRESGEDSELISRADWLQARREELHQRIHHRRGLFGHKHE